VLSHACLITECDGCGPSAAEWLDSLAAAVARTLRRPREAARVWRPCPPEPGPPLRAPRLRSLLASGAVGAALAAPGAEMRCVWPHLRVDVCVKVQGHPCWCCWKLQWQSAAKSVVRVWSRFAPSGHKVNVGSGSAPAALSERFEWLSLPRCVETQRCERIREQSCKIWSAE
jgi:hypothetical protein